MNTFYINLPSFSAIIVSNEYFFYINLPSFFFSDDRKAMESWKRYLRFDDSKIVDMFVGQLKSSLKCSVCSHTSVTFDPFWDLSLPIPNKSGTVKLNQCLDLFTKEEVMDGDERPVSAMSGCILRCL